MRTKFIPDFKHWTIWGPPLKIKISKIGLRHVSSWPKLVPKFHDPGTFGGFGKRGQTHRQDSCFISIDLRMIYQNEHFYVIPSEIVHCNDGS